MALVVLIAVIAVITQSSGSSKTPTPHAHTSPTLAQGPTVYVTNLSAEPISVIAYAGAKPVDVDPGMGTQIDRLNAPPAPWPVRLTSRSTGKTLFVARLVDGDIKQFQVTDKNISIVNLLHEQDAADHEGDAQTPTPFPPKKGPTLPPAALAPFTGPETTFTSSSAGSAANRRELASGLIEPNRSGCDAAGKVVVSDWGTLSYRNLDGSGSTTDVNLPSPTGDLAYQLYGDPQITRLNDGDLVYSRVVALFTPITPKPSWFSYNNSYWRGGLALWRSHCGDDWKLATVLDSNSIYDGKCAFPQGNPTQHWFGGFDRPEMATDPYTGAVNVSTYCTGGTAEVFPPAQAFDHAFVVSWDPAANKWTAKNDLSPHQAPNTITSSPNRLFEFRCEGWPAGPPKLYASVDGGNKFDAGLDLSGGDASITCQNNPRDLTTELGYYTNAPDFGVARLSANAVRVVYPSVTDGRQSLRVDDVTYAGGEFPNGVAHRAPIVSQWADGSIGHFTFIEADGSFPGLKAGDQYATVLAWQEYSPSKKLHQERAVLFHGTTQIGGVQTLSAAWAVDDVGYWTGDYEYGAFGFWDNACHFLAPWNATEKGTTAGLYIHHAMITDATCTGSTTPPPTTATTSKPLVTATTLTPITSQAFAVTGITLTIQTCTRTGVQPNPWVCPLTGHFTLKPGLAGNLHWQVRPTVVWYDSCGGNSDGGLPSQPQPDQAVAENQSTIDVNGSIVFPDSREPVSAAANPPANQISQAHALSGSVQSADVPFFSNGNCKP